MKKSLGLTLKQHMAVATLEMCTIMVGTIQSRPLPQEIKKDSIKLKEPFC